MAESLTGMIGKSFVYEEREKIKRLQEVITGTIPAFVGGANWGLINSPTFVLKDFEGVFGSPLTRDDLADYSGQSAVYALNYTPFLWFTRVSDGSDAKASYNIFKAATPAEINGTAAVRDLEFTIYSADDPMVYNSEAQQNNQLNFSVLTDASPTPVNVPVTLNATAPCVAYQNNISVAAVPVKSDDALVRAAGNLAVGTQINIQIDDVDYRYLVKNEYVDGTRNPDTPDFTDLIVPATGDYSDLYAGGADTYASYDGDFDLPDLPAVAATFSGTILMESGFGDPSQTIILTADTPGIAGNSILLTGNGVDDLADLVDAWNTAHPTNTVTLTTGDTTWVPSNAQAMQLANGSDITPQTDTVTVECNQAGVAGNVTITGDGTKTITELFTELAPLTFNITAGGALVLKTGSTIILAGGAAASLQWDAYTAADTVNTYAKRYAYALREHVIVPKLMSQFSLSINDARTIAARLVVTVETTMTLNSIKAGTASKIKIFTLPKMSTATSDNPTQSIGSNTDISSIISQINTAINNAVPNSAIASIDAETYVFNLSSYGSGTSWGVQINATEIADANIYSLLGLTVGSMVYGADAVADAGTFEAICTGSDGNTITLTKTKSADGYSLAIAFQGYDIATFFNYSYTVADSSFLGKLIANDTAASKVLSLILPTGTVTMPELPYGTITLAGGTSGVSALTDTQYNYALEQYKNIDLYNMDIICVAGHTSQSVQDKIEEVCEYRRDCFAIIDAPESVAGTMGSVYAMIDWHNGNGDLGRDEKLTSKFLSTYYPWVNIDDTTDAGANYYPPSVRVIGAICNSDKINGNKFAAPAGNLNASITQVNALAKYLREDEKQRLYADELDNNINPIVYTTTRGFFLDGQKDCRRGGAAISRLNVLRTSLYIKKRIYEITPNYFWKPLTKRTMDNFAYELKTIGEYLSSAEVNAIKTDFVVTCDTTINTELIEAQRGLIGIIEWTPVRSIEKIKVISIIRDMAVEVTFG